MKTKHLLSTLWVLGLATALHAQDTTSLAKPKPLSKFDGQNPVFKLQGEQLSNKNGFMRYYVLTGYREGVEPINEAFGLNFNARMDKLHGTHRIQMYNLSIADMLTHGLRKPDRVILQVKDPSKYRYDPKYGDEKEWLRKNGYCYEIMMPMGAIKSMKMVNDELCRLFKVKCSAEKRMIEGKEEDVFVITGQ